MFGSTGSAFGQSSGSPFGSPSVFGQTSNAGSNPFSPQPFGGTATFGGQTGSSMFGGTATGVFGATSSPFSSSTTFGASSSPAFGSSTPAFGSSTFGQKPSFGGFGSTPNQTSPFGSSTSQPAYGSSVFGSSAPFGASSQPAFGATSSPGFGATSSPAFGATSTPAFGATSTPAFGTTAFGSTGSAFGVSSTPAFGSGGAFGASSTSVFGSNTPAFGASSTPSFGASSTPAFGASSNPTFGFGSSPVGQSSSAFASSSPFGSSTLPFGAQSSPQGAQATTPAFGATGFGHTAFGTQRGGSRVSPYTPTTETDTTSGQQAGKLFSISAMPAYKDKTHEELRFEDYSLGDKGGPSPAAQSASGIGFGSSTGQQNPFSSNPAFGQSSSSAFSSSTANNPFGQKTSTFTGFGSSSSASFNSSPFGASSSSGPLGSTSQPLYGSSASFGTSSPAPLFGSTTSSGFGSSPSLFNTGAAQGSAPSFSSGFNFANTQSSPLFTSSTPAFGQQSAPAFGQQSAPAFGQQSAPAFGQQSAPAFGQSTSAFGSSSTPSFGQTNTFNPSSSGFGGGLFSSTPSLGGQSTPAFSSPFQPAQPAQASSGFGFSFPQSQGAGTSGFSGSSIFGQSNFGQSSATQSSTLVQTVPVTNPFGTLPAVPQMSIGRAGTGSSIQYGISSMPVVDKPAPVRISSLWTPRHLSQRRIRLSARKYHPNSYSSKVAFFSEDEETPSTPKADALFIPRENPRALVIRPIEQWPLRSNADKGTPLKTTSVPPQENGGTSEVGCNPTSSTNGSLGNIAGSSADNGYANGQSNLMKASQKPNGLHESHSVEKLDSYMTVSGHRAGEAAIAYEHGADVEALMPKLRHPDYYTEPPIKELAAKERAEPGFCSHVKDFVVGRSGYGSVKFYGETDVRRLDLESFVQFNNREVIVYMDETKKPPVGEGLNKPAEITLLNIKFFDKSTGNQHIEGPKVKKYEEMLRKKTEAQGAEFVSYDPIKGEWKFRVSHFSKYKLEDEEEDGWGI